MPFVKVAISFDNWINSIAKVINVIVYHKD